MGFIVLNSFILLAVRGALFVRHRQVPFRAHLIGLFQDGVVFLELVIVLTLFLPLGVICGICMQLLLICDVLLDHHMQMRMQLSHLKLLRDVPELYPSAKKLGLFSFLGMGVVAVISSSASLYGELPVPQFSWTLLGLTILMSIVVLWSQRHCGKAALYPVHNFLFGAQEALIRRWMFPSANAAISPSFSWKPPSSESYRHLSESNPLARMTTGFQGHKEFEIKLHPDEKPHVVVLILESFRAQSVGPLATPHFNRLIQEGILFSQFYSNGTLSYQALLGILYGLPTCESYRHLGSYHSIPLTGLPELFRSAGYHTGFHHNGLLSLFQERDFHRMHFDEVFDGQEIEKSGGFPPNCRSGWGLYDEYLMRHAAAWLEQQSSPTLMVMTTVTNHHPWEAPLHHVAPDFSSCGNGVYQRFLKTMHYTDACLNEFVTLLRQKDLSRKTILVVVGDHGQPMGEHQGNLMTCNFLYEENVHVPLLILAEGRIHHPKVISSLGSHVDLIPTLMDVLQIQGMHHGVGSSLMRKEQERWVMMHNPYEPGFRGCRFGEWKWIQQCLSSQGELYRLKDDPHESVNCIATYPHIAQQLSESTDAYFIQIARLYQEGKIGYGELKKTDLKADHLLELTFSRTLITDDKLIAIARTVPKLKILVLGECLLLTDRGIAAILAHCPYLEAIDAPGVTDLTDALFTEGLSSERKYLFRVNFADADQLTDTGVLHLARSCPRLETVMLNANRMTDEALFHLAEHNRHLGQVMFVNADRLTDLGFKALCERNPHIHRLSLVGGAGLTDQFLSQLKHLPLEKLQIRSAPQLTDAGIAALKGLPLQSLDLTDCPGLTPAALSIVKSFNLSCLRINHCSEMTTP